MRKQVVYRYDSEAATEGHLFTFLKCINVNNEIGLDPTSSYTLPQHLADLQEYEGLNVSMQYGNVVIFSDGQMKVFDQRDEQIVGEAVHPMLQLNTATTVAISV